MSRRTRLKTSRCPPRVCLFVLPFKVLPVVQHHLNLPSCTLCRVFDDQSSARGFLQVAGQPVALSHSSRIGKEGGPSKHSSLRRVCRPFVSLDIVRQLPIIRTQNADGWIDTSSARFGQPNELHIVSDPNEFLAITYHDLSFISSTLREYWFHTSAQAKAVEAALALSSCIATCASLHASRMEARHLRCEAAALHQEISCLCGQV